MFHLRLLGLLVAFGLVSGVCIGDEPKQPQDAAAAGSAAKSPSDTKRSDKFPLKPDDEYYDLFRSLADTVDQVERNYVQEVDRRELMEAAIKGVLSKLDPYSNYISPGEFSGFKTSVESQFGGIGIQITIDDGQLKVLSPLVGTPAYRAGIQAGDRIIKVEGEPSKGIDVDEAVRRLKGEAGTTVTFTVLHAIDNSEETVTLKREVIHVDTVMGDRRKPNDEWNFMLDDDKRIGYIRLTAFSRDTAGDLRKALEDLAGRNLRGLILDLRFNPGGLLSSAVDVSDLFLSSGKIVSTKGRSVPEHTWEAKKEGTFEGFPMVVLVNRYSASASEIVSAALQDHNRAVNIGERTWGKGSVKNVIELESGKSALKLTTASYQRPNGHNIHRFPNAKETDEWGVKPNDGYMIRLSDRELGRLVQYRRERDILVAKPRGAGQPSATDDKQEQGENGDKPDAGDKPTKGGGKPDASGKPAAEDKQKETDEPDKSSDDKPQEVAKPHDDKPSDADKADDASQPDADNPDDAAGGQDKSQQDVSPHQRPQFVDRQLQKAVEYLSSELARAG
jgi:carboxyl-terminal processing protease